eukprot:m.40431 g.40431  ORF g.40431 m.40431 type:complete len:341 (+) comp32971_c0_seq5:30-1052(+)
MTASLWGEISIEPSIPQIEIPDPKPSESTQPKVKGYTGRTTQPSSELQICYPVNGSGENLCLHNIQMLSHLRNMRQMVSKAQAKRKLLEAKRISMDDLQLPMSCLNQPNQFFKRKLSYEPSHSEPAIYRAKKEATELKTGPLSESQLDCHSVWTLMRKGVEATVAHSGYDCATESSVEILTDVLGENLTKMCSLLRDCRDREGLVGPSGYPDCMERMLHGVGLNGIGALQKFWLENVWDYGVHLQKVAESLEREYYVIKSSCRNAKLEEMANVTEEVSESDVDLTSPGVVFTPRSESDVSTPASFLSSPAPSKSKSRPKGKGVKTRRVGNLMGNPSKLRL